MSDIRFTGSLADAVRGKDHVVLVGPVSVLAKKQPWKRLFKGRWTSAIAGMLEGVAPGGLGKVVATWPGVSGAPKRVSLCILPDGTSRHVSPSRAHAIASSTGKADIKRGEKTALVLVLDDPAHCLAAANAAARCVRLWDAKSAKRKPWSVVIAAMTADGRAIPPPAQAEAVVASSRWAASMVDKPTAELDTAAFVEEARAHVKGLSGVKISVIVGDSLVVEGLRGIHAVGRAAQVAPRLLVLEHAPRGTREHGQSGAKQTIALVGKGVVYDTGGLALKPRDGMSGMKGDMGGGAAVVGAFRVLASKCPHRLLALVPLAENAIGSGAYRNDDILRMHSGRTVEINNTDAEGRLLLADGVSYAARRLGARVVIDAATLTGAQLVATGRRHAAVVSNLEGLERLAVECGRASGDLVHPLPFAPELFQREFRSEVADMKNSVKDRTNAQASCAAQFVWRHIDDMDVAWLHVDMAGPADAEEKGTGYGVALLAEVVSRVSPGDLR